MIKDKLPSDWFKCDIQSDRLRLNAGAKLELQKSRWYQSRGIEILTSITSVQCVWYNGSMVDWNSLDQAMLGEMEEECRLAGDPRLERNDQPQIYWRKNWVSKVMNGLLRHRRLVGAEKWRGIVEDESQRATNDSLTESTWFQPTRSHPVWMAIPKPTRRILSSTGSIVTSFYEEKNEARLLKAHNQVRVDTLGWSVIRQPQDCDE